MFENWTEAFQPQIGGSFIIAENGYELLTGHPKQVDDVILS